MLPALRIDDDARLHIDSLMLPALLTDGGGVVLVPSLHGGLPLILSGRLFLNLRCVSELELVLLPIPIPAAGGSDAVEE